MSDPWGNPGRNDDPANRPFGAQQPAGQYPPQYSGDAGMGQGGPNDFQQQQYPYAQPGYGYPMGPPPKQSNGMAIAGFVLAFLFWPLGLILSIVGLVRAGKLGGAGKKLAVAGLILSVVFGGVSIAVIANQVSNSTAADPGCTSAESSLGTLDPQLSSAETKMSSDASSGDATALKADLGTMVSDLQVAQTDLNHSESVAVHPQVKTQITAVNNDLAAVITAFQAVSNGDDSQVSAMTTTAQQLETDGSALDTICSAY